MKLEQTTETFGVWDGADRVLTVDLISAVGKEMQVTMWNEAEEPKKELDFCFCDTDVSEAMVMLDALAQVRDELRKRLKQTKGVKEYGNPHQSIV